MKNATIMFLVSVFLVSSVFAYTYSWEQFDGSISYYEMVSTDNPDIKISKLISIQDIELKITRLPYAQEVIENKYIPMCFER